MSTKSAPALKPLRVNDLLFINEYLANGRNGTRAYQVAHPKASYNVARARASQVLAKGCVQAEIAKRITHEAGITRDLVESNLLAALALANATGDAAVIASVTMDCAKLAGFLVEKRADVTPSPSLTPEQLADELRKRGFVSVPTN